MTTQFEIVTIVGVGLLGGSLGLALKERGLAGTVRGVGRRQSSLDTALAIGAIDDAYLDLREASIGANLVVLATPAATVPAHMDIVRTVCSTTTVVTDVASTKSEICAHTRKSWSAPYRFIGSHPMAGSEKFGPEHAEAGLYENSICFVEKLDGHAPDAHAAVVDLWESLGATVVPVDPELHDAMVARTSHVPHIVASALACLAADRPGIAPFVGNGFRDTTRVAEGRPEIWRDICLTNPEAIQQALSEITAILQETGEAIHDRDAARLDEIFKRGRDARRKVLEE